MGFRGTLRPEVAPPCYKCPDRPKDGGCGVARTKCEKWKAYEVEKEKARKAKEESYKVTGVQYNSMHKLGLLKDSKCRVKFPKAVR